MVRRMWINRENENGFKKKYQTSIIWFFFLNGETRKLNNILAQKWVDIILLYNNDLIIILQYLIQIIHP